MREVAKKCLAQRLKKLLKRARHLDTLDDHKRHRVRIAAKKLRYMCEFFASLLSGKKEKHRFDRLIAKLEKMQDGLGALQDEVNFAKLAAEVLGKDATPPTGSAPVDRAAEMRKAVKASAELARAQPFWLKW